MLQNKHVIKYKCDVEGCPSVTTIERNISNDSDFMLPSVPTLLPPWLSIGFNKHICGKHKFEIKVDDKVVLTNIKEVKQ